MATLPYEGGIFKESLINTKVIPSMMQYNIANILYKEGKLPQVRYDYFVKDAIKRLISAYGYDYDSLNDATFSNIANWDLSSLLNYESLNTGGWTRDDNWIYHEAQVIGDTVTPGYWEGSFTLQGDNKGFDAELQDCAISRFYKNMGGNHFGNNTHHEFTVDIKFDNEYMVDGTCCLWAMSNYLDTFYELMSDSTKKDGIYLVWDNNGNTPLSFRTFLSGSSTYNTHFSKGTIGAYLGDYRLTFVHDIAQGMTLDAFSWWQGPGIEVAQNEIVCSQSQRGLTYNSSHTIRFKIIPILPYESSYNDTFLILAYKNVAILPIKYLNFSLEAANYTNCSTLPWKVSATPLPVDGNPSFETDYNNDINTYASLQHQYTYEGVTPAWWFDMYSRFNDVFYPTTMPSSRSDTITISPRYISLNDSGTIYKTTVPSVTLNGSMWGSAIYSRMTDTTLQSGWWLIDAIVVKLDITAERKFKYLYLANNSKCINDCDSVSWPAMSSCVTNVIDGEGTITGTDYNKKKFSLYDVCLFDDLVGDTLNLYIKANSDVTDDLDLTLLGGEYLNSVSGQNIELFTEGSVSGWRQKTDNISLIVNNNVLSDGMTLILYSEPTDVNDNLNLFSMDRNNFENLLTYSIEDNLGNYTNKYNYTRLNADLNTSVTRSWSLTSDEYNMHNSFESIEEYDGELYFGIASNAGSGIVVKYDGTTFTDYNMTTETGGPNYTTVEALCEYDGKLYCGMSEATGSSPTYIPSPSLADIIEFDGDTWNVSWDDDVDATLLGLSVHSRVECLCEYDGKLYAGFGTGRATAPTISRADILVFDGINWTVSKSFAYNEYTRVLRLCEYNGKLYAGLGQGNGYAAVYEFDGATWSLSNAFDSTLYAVRSMEVYNNKLYVGFESATPTQHNPTKLYSFDGTDWELVYTFTQQTQTDPLHYDYQRVESLCAVNDYLYIGTRWPDSDPAPGSTEYHGATFIYDGVNDPVLDNDFEYEQIEHMHIYDNKLYIGTGRTVSANIYETLVDDNTRLYKDFGVGAFRNLFDIDFEFEVHDSLTESEVGANIFALSNVITDSVDWWTNGDDAVTVSLLKNGANNAIQLRNIDESSTHTANISLNTHYYARFSHSLEESSNNWQWELKLYTESTRTTTAVVSLLLPDTTNTYYRYLLVGDIPSVTTSENIDFMIENIELLSVLKTSTIDLYTCGYTGDNSNATLFIEGWRDTDNSYINMFVYGGYGNYYLYDSMNLYVSDNGDWTGSATLFIKNTDPYAVFDNNINLYMLSAGTECTNAIDLYVYNNGIYESLPLRIKGAGYYVGAVSESATLGVYINRESESDYIPLVIYNNALEDNSYLTLFIDAITGTSNDSINLSLPNVVAGVENSYIELHTISRIEVNDNLSLVLPLSFDSENSYINLVCYHGGGELTDDMDLYTFGAYLANSNMNLVLPSATDYPYDNIVLYINGY